MTRRDRYEGYLRSLIQEAVDAGEMRDVDVAMAGRLILSSLNWMHRWYNPAKSMKPEQIADRLLRHGLQRPSRRAKNNVRRP